MLCPMPAHHGGPIPDLTDVETIYHRSLHTVLVRVHRDHARSSDVALTTVTRPADVHDVLGSLFAGLDDDQEHFLLLVLNQARQITGYKLLASGAQDFVVVDAKIVFRNALLLGAACVIVAHNHPSGSLVPSAADWTITRKLIQAGRVLDVPVLDHILYTPQGCHSLQQENPALFA